MSNPLKFADKKKQDAAVLAAHNDFVRAKKLLSCGSYIGVSEEGNCFNSSRCRDRGCIDCMGARKATRKRQIACHLMHVNISDYCYEFVTVSPPCVALRDLNMTLDRLGDLWLRARRTKALKAILRGYLINKEITYSGHLVHPHIHILTASQKHCSDIIKAAIDSSSKNLLDDLHIHTERASASDLTQIFGYMNKAFDYFENIENATEVLAMVHKKRMLSAGGIFKGWNRAKMEDNRVRTIEIIRMPL